MNIHQEDTSIHAQIISEFVSMYDIETLKYKVIVVKAPIASLP